MIRADTLAETFDVSEVAFVATVERWNAHAAEGEDPDFGRGRSVHDRWWGDQNFGDGPAATIGPVDRAPYYAVRVYSGALGTKGGPRTNSTGQVIHVDGQTSPGSMPRETRRPQ